jgi:hypothetical protein
MSGLPPFTTELRNSLVVRFVPEAEVIGAFGHGVESLPTTARGTLRAVLQCNRRLYAPARQMSEISCQSHLEAAVSLNSSTLPHVLSVTAKTS